MAEESLVLFGQATGHGHAHTMDAVGSIHYARKEYILAVEWCTKGADAGLPRAIVQPRALYRHGGGRGGAGPRGDGAIDADGLAVARDRAWQIVPAMSATF